MASPRSDRVNRLHPSATLAMSARSAELKAQGVDVINMSVGEPDFNTPDHIKAAAVRAVEDNWSRYSPVPGYPALREAICAKLKNENGLDYRPAQIVVSNGAKQSVAGVLMAQLHNLRAVSRQRDDQYREEVVLHVGGLLPELQMQ